MAASAEQSRQMDGTQRTAGPRAFPATRLWSSPDITVRNLTELKRCIPEKNVRCETVHNNKVVQIPT